MNIKLIILAAAACVVTSTSFAGNVNQFTDLKFVSSKSRPEVVAELKQARAQGQVARGEEFSYPTYSASTSMKSRDEVRKEITRSAYSRTANLDYEVAM